MFKQYLIRFFEQIAAYGKNPNDVINHANNTIYQINHNKQMPSMIEQLCFHLTPGPLRIANILSNQNPCRANPQMIEPLEPLNESEQNAIHFAFGNRNPDCDDRNLADDMIACIRKQAENYERTDSPERFINPCLPENINSRGKKSANRYLSMHFSPS